MARVPERRVHSFQIRLSASCFVRDGSIFGVFQHAAANTKAVQTGTCEKDNQDILILIL